MAAHQKGGSSRQGRGGKSEIDAGKALGEARTSGAGNTISATGDGMPQDVVTLVSMDGDSFVVEALAIMASQLIKVMVDGSSGEEAKEIPLPNMRSNVLAKVVEFCKRHRVDPMKKIPKPIQYGLTVSDHVQEWYGTFVAGLDDEMLFELLLAANYLDLAPLLDLCAATIGLRTMNKSPEEIAREFNITEPFSPEVERKLREENKWSTEPPASR